MYSGKVNHLPDYMERITNESVPPSFKSCFKHIWFFFFFIDKKICF